MKFTAWTPLALVAVLVLASPACKKAPPQIVAQDRYGLGIDWPKLDTEFRNNDPAVQAAASFIKRSILYHQFPQAIADIEKLATNPSLSGAQKKILADLREQTQQVMAKAASPQPAQ